MRLPFGVHKAIALGAPSLPRRCFCGKGGRQPALPNPKMRQNRQPNKRKPRRAPRRQEVHRVVVEPAAPLQRCSQQAVEEQPEDPARRATLVAKKTGPAAYHLDIVLQGAGEMVFFAI